MKIKVLGSGTAAISKDRNPTGFWVEAGGKKILLDAGYGICRRICDNDLNLQDIDIMTISHFHADHCGDAFNLVFARFVEDSYFGRQPKKLVMIGPKGLEKSYLQWREIFWPGEEVYPIIFVEMTGKIPTSEVGIASFEVKHVPYLDSIGIRIENEGKTLVYTGDIGSDSPMKDLVKVCQGADLLITEASYKERTASHFTFEQVKELREKARVKKLMVAHISPTQEERIRTECKKFGMMMAEEGMMVEI